MDRTQSVLKLIGLSGAQRKLPTSLPYGNQRKLARFDEKTKTGSGFICAQGTPAQIQSDPDVIKTYLGKTQP